MKKAISCLARRDSSRFAHTRQSEGGREIYLKRGGTNLYWKDKEVDANDGQRDMSVSRAGFREA